MVSGAASLINAQVTRWFQILDPHKSVVPLMSLPASTAHRAVVNILMMWVESLIGVTMVLTMSDKAVAVVISLRHGTSSIFAAEARGSARCAEVNAEADTFTLA